MSDLSDCARVLAHYSGLGDLRSEQVEPLASAGGFSGARIWRVQAPDRLLCLKCWPAESPTDEQIAWIHSVLLHVRRTGIRIVPVPCWDRLGRTAIREQDRLWELTPWLPGRADFWDHPLPAKLEAAMRALAEFHRAAATFPQHAPQQGRSPGIGQRWERVRHDAAGGLDDLLHHIVPDVWPAFCDRARQALRTVRSGLGSLEILLEAVSVWEVPLQICIRDVWHDHLLFTDDRVTGLVDFGAMGVETVAADIARLLGSMLSESPAGGSGATSGGSLWRTGVAAYESIRPLSEHEKALVEVFDRCGTLLGAVNWVEWLYRDRLPFGDPMAVARRLDQILSRLEHFGSTRFLGGDGLSTQLWS